MPDMAPKVIPNNGDSASEQVKTVEAAAPWPSPPGDPASPPKIKEPGRTGDGRFHSDTALSESETRFRTIFENSGSGMALVDMQGYPVECNPALQKLLGYTEEELCDMAFPDFTHPDDRELDWRLYNELSAGKRDKYEIEKRFVTKDKQIIWGNLVVSLVKDKEGVPKYAVGMFQDITKRKLAEEELRRVSERLQLATRAARIGTWDWDVVKDKVVWDAAMYDLFGIHKEDFNGAYNAWACALAPEDFDRARVEVQAALRGEREFDSEFRIVWPDGSTHFIKADSQTFRDEEGHPLRMVGVNYDITEHKLAEEKLRWSEERLRLILDSAAEGIFGVGLDGKCMFCNAASLRLLGYDQSSDLLNRDVHALIANRRADGTPYPIGECPAMQSLRSIKGAFSDKDVFWRKDDTCFPVEYWSYPIFRENKHIGAVITFLDITERKLAEESLRLSEERFAKAFHASPEPISIFRHQDGILLEVNERWTSVYGYTREEAVGHTSLELNMVIPGDRSKLKSLLEKQHSVREFPIDLRTRGGEIRHISLSAEQIVINNELCNIFLHHDITEHRRAEQEKRKLIHSLGERVKELTALQHSARILQDENKSVPELLQEIVELLPPAWQYPEITAARIIFGELEFKTENYEQTIWSQVAEFEAAGVTGSVEVVYTEERTAEDVGPFLLEERNLINSLAEMLRSALNRRHAQEALSESEGRLRQLTDNVREVLWLYTPDYDKVLYISPAYESVWGRTRESLYRVPDSFFDAIHTDDRARVEETIRRARGFDYEYRIVRPDGSVRWIWDRGFPIKNQEGRVYRVAGIAEDITERKEAAELLIASREQLRALSESLRRAKEEEGIRIAREIHDELGSALTSLKWGLLGLDKVYSKVETSVSESSSREKIEEMVGLVDATINTVRRISSELRPGVLDDLGLVSAIEWHAHQFQAHTGIVCRFDPQIENVELSREQATTLFRIFQEAMTNILRHARASKVNILIEEEEDEFVLEVIDNGRGITESEKLGIRSLGLLGMRERAHSIGGRIEITGNAGKGTTLIVRFPLQANNATSGRI